MLDENGAAYPSMDIPGTKVKFICDDSYTTSTFVSEFTCVQEGIWFPYLDEVKCLSSAITSYLFVTSALKKYKVYYFCSLSGT